MAETDITETEIRQTNHHIVRTAIPLNDGQEEFVVQSETGKPQVLVIVGKQTIAFGLSNASKLIEMLEISINNAEADVTG